MTISRSDATGGGARPDTREPTADEFAEVDARIATGYWKLRPCSGVYRDCEQAVEDVRRLLAALRARCAGSPPVPSEDAIRAARKQFWGGASMETCLRAAYAVDRAASGGPPAVPPECSASPNGKHQPAKRHGTPIGWCNWCSQEISVLVAAPGAPAKEGPNDDLSRYERLND